MPENNFLTSDLYNIFSILFPDNKQLGMVTSFAVGSSATFILRFIVFVPSHVMSSISSSDAQFAFTRLFTMVYFGFYMMVWRGWWTLLSTLDIPLGLLLGLGVFALVFACSLASNVGPPLVVNHDTK